MSKEQLNVLPESIHLGTGLVAVRQSCLPMTLDIREHTELMVATLDSLDLVDDISRLTASVEQSMNTLRQTLDKIRKPNTPEVEPYLNITLDDRFTLGSLIAAFDKKQDSTSFVYHDLWNKYSATELNRTTLTYNDDSTQPYITTMILGGDREQEPGLYYTNLNAKDQGEAVRRHRQSLVTPAGYIMLNAQRRLAGRPLLDRITFSRFIQLPERTVDGDSVVCDANLYNNRLVLDGSYGHARSIDGIRLSLGHAKLTSI